MHLIQSRLFIPISYLLVFSPAAFLQLCAGNIVLTIQPDVNNDYFLHSKQPDILWQTIALIGTLPEIAGW